MNTDAPGSQPLWEDLLLSSDPGVNGFFNSPAVTVGDVGAFSHAVDAYAHNNGSSDPCSSTYISAAQLPDLPPSLPSLENTVCDDDFLMPDIDDFLNNTIAQQDEFLNEMTFRTYMEPGNPTPELWSAEPQAPLLHRKRTRPCSTTSHDTDSPKRKVKVVGKKSAFTQFQTEVLEDWLSRNLADPFPSPEIKASLANSTGLSVRQVERWFARTRQRKLTRLKLEEAGSIGGEEVMAPSQAHPQQGPELRRHGPPEHASSHHEFEMQGRACRSLTGTRTGKMWSFGCLKKRYSLLKDVYTLGSGWRGTSAAAASLNRPSSCPPPSSMAGFLDLFLPRSCGAQSATNGKYSLQVGLPSHPGSPWSIPKSNSRNSNDGRGETAYLEPMWYLQDWGVERWLELLPTDPCGFEALNESERDREPAPDMQGAECRRGGRALNGYGHCDHFLGQLSSGTADPITSLDVRGRSSEHAGSNESSLAGTHANQNRNTEVSAVFTSPQPLQDEATGSKDPGEVASSHAPPELNNAEPHICRICSHSFAKIAQLKRHCQSHFSSKGPFKCLYCSHSFTFSYNLYRHQIRRHPKLRPAAQPSLQRRSSAGKVDSGHQQHSYGASGLQPDQSPGAGNQDFGWNGSAATTQNGAGSPYRYAESLGGSSGAASVASCSSYLTFGPRKGRRVAYGGTSPGVASTSPPTAAWGRDRLPTPPERSNVAGNVFSIVLSRPRTSGDL
ncbi:hypothetical protein A1O7_04297 [Cladophialophora yegresii CBS 114405]|uniref:Homeobox domain-containing protein n=1 Tax=Cladophialophora yegresii CBS 114405 TaxID=1182544 RepID=W9W571_9EURO|nr:uncharacterized protein A1O7_04297 [Cladophialophora yegresii CBS 114405]EXJ60145.1 hypothetical protein A1O7_04297 [Cladophialophora yegresii CBS 114405]